MKIIDFRYRPSTRASLDSVIKNPVYCEYIKKTDFCSRPEKSLPECIDELRGLDIAKAVVSGRDIESTPSKAPMTTCCNAWRPRPTCSSASGPMIPTRA